jgi:hypothetical protein
MNLLTARAPRAVGLPDTRFFAALQGRAGVSDTGSAVRTIDPGRDRWRAGTRGVRLALVFGWLLSLVLAGCSQFNASSRPPPDKGAPRVQLSIGYSLLYQEADGIPKLNWLLMFKSKSQDMAKVTSDLLAYYRQLAATMQSLSKRYPAVRLDVTPMSEIESAERKAIGADMAKDFAPVAGKSGVDFEREVLLMFFNTLNEQRHLVGVMLNLETVPELRKFLQNTRSQLDERYTTVEALLNRRYFTH